MAKDAFPFLTPMFPSTYKFGASTFTLGILTYFVPIFTFGDAMLIFESHFPAEKFILPPTETLGAAAVTPAFDFPIETLGTPILTSALTDYGA
jgi:hypothetical protein